MICLGLTTSACSKLLAAWQSVEEPLRLYQRLGNTGSIVALSLALVRAVGQPLAKSLQAYFGSPSGSGSA